MARFRARRANGDGGWCAGVVQWCVRGSGGGGVVCSQNVRRGAGGPKKTKTSFCGSVSGCSGAAGGGGGCCGVTVPLPC